MKDKNIFIAFLIFLATFFLLFLTIDDMGPTWDELYLNDDAAKSFAEWIKNSSNSFLAGDIGYFCRKENIDRYFRDGLHYHPPFGRILHALSYLAFNDSLEEFEALRMSPMIMFSILVGLLYLSIARSYDRKSGVFAVIGFITMPRVFGHAHIFALDTPIMFMWFLTAYCFLKGVENRIWSLFTAIAWGLAMDTKAQGYLIIVPLITASIILILNLKSEIRNPNSELRSGILRNFLLMLIISPVVVYLANPWLWHNLIENFSTFSTAMKSHAKDIGVTTYYLGKVYHPSNVPWHYPFVLTFVTVPPLIFTLSIYGGLLSIKREIPLLCKGGVGLLFLINAIAAISMLALPFAPKYDGVRLILSAFPFIAGLSGIGFYYLTDWTAKRLKGKEVKRRIGVFTFFLMIILLLPSIKEILMIRPYYLSYYNSFIGGVRGARDKGFETTYWGDPLNKSFIEYLNNHFAGKIFKNRTGYHRVPFDFYHDKGLLREDIRHDWDEYDYYMLNMRQSYFDEEARFYYRHQEPVYSVKVQGVELVNIYHAIEKPEARSQKSEVRMNKEGLWKGLILIKKDGEYEIGAALSGRAVISVDSSEVLNESRMKKSLFTKRLRLSKGFHRVEIEYSFIKGTSPLLFLSIKPLDRNFPLPYFRY